VPANPVHAHAGGNLVITVMEHHTVSVDRPHDGDDVLDLECVAQAARAHVATRGERHLAILKVEGRRREQLEVPGVIVVQMGDNDVADGTGIRTHGLQGLGDPSRDPATALLGDPNAKARVNDNLLVRRAQQPNEVVHRHQCVMRISRRHEKVVAHSSLMRRVPQGVDLPLCHGPFPCFEPLQRTIQRRWP
jgi:hypothetical protein